MMDQTVFVVDDNDEFRMSTVWLLEGEGYQVKDYANPEVALEALQAVGSDRQCCLLLDVRMPGISGLDLHDQINAKNIRIPVVYMTGHGDVPIAVEAMRKGAVTFLEKPLQPEALELALKTAFEAAKRAMHSVHEDAIPEQKKADFQQSMLSLTPRESDVLNSIVAGNANKVCAADLGISIRTVELHRSHLMKKLKVRSASELVKMVLLCQ